MNQEQLAASQAREQQLREAMNDYFNQYPHMAKGYILDALALPADTSALEALIAKAGEVMQRQAAEICDRFQARDVGMQPAECAGAIRALPSVTLKDLQ